jgi:hypothetical protein
MMMTWTLVTDNTWSSLATIEPQIRSAYNDLSDDVFLASP